MSLKIKVHCMDVQGAPAFLRSLKRMAYLQSLLQLMSVHLDKKCLREDRKNPTCQFYCFRMIDNSTCLLKCLCSLLSTFFQADDVVCMFVT